ncbi:MAG TPA: hypothetical protein VJ939_02035 [Bacteroidales bacterium]|nr:hypothetical protein [Bacteroidales bacterium]
MSRITFFLGGLIVFLVGCGDVDNTVPDAFILEKQYGGDSLDFAVQITETTEGDYLILGRSNSYGLGLTDAYLLKVDKQGKKIWDDYYGGANFDDAYAMVPANDGGNFIIGSTLSFGAGGMDMMLIKTDRQGQQEFFKTFGDLYYDKGFFIEEAEDGNYLIGGYITNIATQDKDMALLKVNESGDELWTQTYGGDTTDIANGVLVMNDGYLVYGKKAISEGNEDIFLVKTDFNGDQLWQKNYGGDGVEELTEVIETDDGNLLGCGYSGSFYDNRNNDLYLLKMNRNGDTLQSNHFGSIGQWDYEEAYAITQASDGGYYVAGRQRSAIWVIKTNQDLIEELTVTFGDVNYQYTRAGFDIIEEDDGKVVVVGGETNSNAGNILFLRLDPQKVQ